MSSLDGRKILVIDDDPAMRSLVELVLTKAGAHVLGAEDAEEGVRRCRTWHPDLVLLDIMMPKRNGFDTCEQLLSYADVPIIFLTALTQQDKVLRGFDSGAVDYITKPFSPDILRARVAVALRKASPPVAIARSDYDDGHLRIDFEKKEVFLRGERVHLTPTEYRLLAYLFGQANRFVPLHDILGHIWGSKYEDSPNYVHVYVWRLRSKLEDDLHHPRYLQSEYGVGYRFVTAPEAAGDDAAGAALGSLKP